MPPTTPTPTSENTFRDIGRGCCGTIYALEATDWVLKREIMHTGRSVQNDQTMHRRVIAAATTTTHTLPVRIPASYEILEADDTWSYRQERIPAIALSIREMLIEKYCREALKDPTRKSKKNEDCLIRIYTGKQRQVGRPPGMFFNLRNYGLCVDQMEELNLDALSIAKVLAEALAHCYWKAEVDANDVEFVLAPAAASIGNANHGSAGSVRPTFRLLDQELVIWMLDYDCVRPMGRDTEGIAQATHAFWRNDPYFPRPYAYGHTDLDCGLWQAFKEHFLHISRSMLMEKCEGSVGEKILDLPQQWVTQIEAEGSKRAAR